MKKYAAEIIICLLIVSASGFIYGQLDDYGYILYDDMLSLYVPFVTEGLSLEKLGQVFYQLPEHLPYQVPIPAIVRLILWELFGNDLGKHHLFSLLLHIICALLLFFLLRNATGKKAESGLCAMLFTVHPINVEAVSWLAGFNGMLEALFLITGLTCYARYVAKPSITRYLLIFPPFVLGLMCRPSMAILPFLMFLLDYWPFRRFSFHTADMKDMIFNRNQNRVITEKLPFIGLIPVYLIAENLITIGKVWHTGSSPWSFHAGAVADFFLHAVKVAYPAGLAIGRPAPPAASMGMVAGLLVIILLISVFLFKKAEKHRPLITGWLWFLTASAPAITMMALSDRPVEDHHLYIPLIGIFILISFGLSSLTSQLRYGRYFFLVAVIIIVSVLMPMAYIQAGYWQNSMTIFSHAVSINPENKKAHANLGDAYMGEKKIDSAVYHYRQFLRLSPDSALGHTKLANALALTDNAAEAVRHFEQALKLSPDYVPAYHGLADLMVRLGETEKAITLYRSALRINPALFQTHNNLALALYEQGRLREAFDHLNQAVRINPAYQTAIQNRRIILENMTKTEANKDVTGTLDSSDSVPGFETSD